MSKMAQILLNAGLPHLAKEAIALDQHYAQPPAQPAYRALPASSVTPKRRKEQPTAGPARDALEGIWSTSGGSWRLTRDKTDYHLEETGALGVTGEGRATFVDGKVYVQCRNILVGPVTSELTLSGDVMHGFSRVWGLQVPIHLQRI